MTTFVYSYDEMTKISQTMNRLKYKFPNDVFKRFANLKDKLNIKESTTFKRPFTIDKTIYLKQKEELAEIFKILNKITDKTYDKLSREIFNFIKNIKDVDCQKEICNKIFEIISTNSFYSEIYARLYSELICIHDSFKHIFYEQYQQYIDSFETIHYVSSNEDYDKYCIYVKHVNSISSMCSFFLSCIKYGICKYDDIMKLVLFFQKKMIDQLENEDKLNENEAYIQNIYSIIKETIGDLIFHTEWEFVIRNNLYLKENNGNGKNNKIRFKLMDIDDIVKKHSNELSFS